ncbi:MAG: hypothetical protein DWI67_08795, partial [Chloroflexi bacterium]
EQEYFEFVVRDWVPNMTKLGIQPVDAWYTIYGECPQILTAGTAADAGTMHRILASDDWLRQRQKLCEYVDNLNQKVITATGGFQL